MSRFEELVNDYTLMGDNGAVIFSSYDQFLEFVGEIRQMEREACAIRAPHGFNRDALWEKNA